MRPAACPLVHGGAVASELSSDPDGMRRDREGEWRGEEPEAADPLDGEACPLDRGERLPARVAAAGESRPDQVEGPLAAGERGRLGANVLVEAQLTAWA